MGRECVEEFAYDLQRPHLFMIDYFTLDGLDQIIHHFIEEYNGELLTLDEGQE